MIDQPLQAMTVCFVVNGEVRHAKHDRAVRADLDDGTLTIGGVAENGAAWAVTYAAGVWLTLDAREVKP